MSFNKLSSIKLMRHLKKENIICFTPYELKELYRHDKKEKLYKILKDKKYSLEELNNDYSKKKEIANSAIREDLKRKEQIEFIFALNSCIVFYGENSEVGFPLKNSYNFEKNPIKNLENLLNAIKEESLIDFLIISDNHIYNFQFKLYKGALETEDFFIFIKEKLKKYGNKMGNVNLLIMLQGPKSIGMQLLNINFKQLRENLKSMNLDFGSSILVRFNGGNKFDYLVEVYPGNSAVKSPIDPNYLAGRLLYS